MLKIAVFDNPTVVWCPLPREPRRIFEQALYFQKVETLAYTFVEDSVGISSFKFLWWALKMRAFCNRVHISSSRSSKVVDFGTNRKGMCDFLLVINSNFAPILQRFWNMATY